MGQRQRTASLGRFLLWEFGGGFFCFVLFSPEVATIVKTSGQRNVSEEEKGVPGGNRTSELGMREGTGISAFCLSVS